MFGFTYINGNPTVREKTRAIISIIVKSIVLGFACIGVGVVLSMIVQIAAW